AGAKPSAPTATVPSPSVSSVAYSGYSDIACRPKLNVEKTVLNLKREGFEGTPETREFNMAAVDEDGSLLQQPKLSVYTLNKAALESDAGQRPDPYLTRIIGNTKEVAGPVMVMRT